MFDEDDRPRRPRKRRGDDPELDALADELAKETGDPLFCLVERREENAGGPGVIVAGGLDEAKAHVRGIRPPAGTSGAKVEKERVVVAREDDRKRETISAALRASRDASRRELESTRKGEAARAEAGRAALETGSARPGKRGLLLGGAAVVVVVSVGAGFFWGRGRGVEPSGSSSVPSASAPMSAASASPAATQTADPAPTTRVLTTSAPGPDPASHHPRAVAEPVKTAAPNEKPAVVGTAVSATPGPERPREDGARRAPGTGGSKPKVEKTPEF
jgi:hypothetical protein